VLKQPSLFEFTSDVVLDAVEKLSNSPSEDRGAVFTKRPIVDFILDLAGYVTSTELLGLRILGTSYFQSSIGCSERFPSALEKTRP